MRSEERQDFRFYPSALLYVRVAGQDELVDPQPPILQDLACHPLIAPDDGRPAVHPDSSSGAAYNAG